MSKMAEASAFVDTRRRFFSPNPFDYDALDDLLARIEDEFNSQACIAGGFLRDAALFQANPKDIDIFIEYDEDRHSTVYKNEARVDSCSPDYNWAGNLQFQSMRDMQFNGEKWKINLIFLKPELTITGTRGFWVDHVIRTFDFGICQVGYSIRQGMRVTRAFELDVYQKTITENPAVPHYRIDERIAKLSGKYPTYTVIRDDRMKKELDEAFEGF